MSLALVFGLLLLTPLAIWLSLLAPRSRPLALRLAPWAALPALLSALAPALPATAELGVVLLVLEISLDTTARVFLLLTGLIWLVGGLVAHGYFTTSEQHRRYQLFALPAMLGNIGLCLATDMGGFLLFFSLMSFSAYGLVVHSGSEAARHAGKVYIILVIVSEVLLFNAFLLLSSDPLFLVGRYEHWIYLLLFLALGIKAGALPLHFWLPLAHPVAPTPASAILSGAMIKAGVIGWLRFLPQGLESTLVWAELLLLAGLAAALLAPLVGLLQTQSKVVLAYSSISQMGWITVLIGLLLLAPGQQELILPVVLFYVLHHALTKTGLFLGVGMVERNSAPWRRLAFGVTALLALIMAGVPLSSGAYAKAGVLGLETTVPGWLADHFGTLLLAGSILTALLMARFLYLLWHSAEHIPWLKPAFTVPWLGLAAIVLLMPLWSAPVLTLAPVWPGISTSAWLPITLAVMLGVILTLWPLRRSPRIPPGDILTLLQPIIAWPHWRVAGRWRWGHGIRLVKRGIENLDPHNLQSLEQLLGRWQVALLALLLVILGLVSLGSF